MNHKQLEFSFSRFLNHPLKLRSVICGSGLGSVNVLLYNDDAIRLGKLLDSADLGINGFVSLVIT